jgi:hypothetical protein
LWSYCGIPEPFLTLQVYHHQYKHQDAAQPPHRRDL